MREKVSVAMATYNGEKFIKQQIESVLNNLGPEDELIISDDGSTDSTKEIIYSFNDPRITLLNGPKKGVKKNFENAILSATGKYIFLCDQDDIWAKDKVDIVCRAFEKRKCKVVVHDCTIIAEDESVIAESFFKMRKSGPGKIKNFIKNTYIGCCMAFDSSLKDKILPIPEDIEMHDQWIGILGDRAGENVFIKDKLLFYRRHGDNTSDCFHHYGVWRMFTNRVILLYYLMFRK